MKPVFRDTSIYQRSILSLHDRCPYIAVFLIQDDLRNCLMQIIGCPHTGVSLEDRVYCILWCQVLLWETKFSYYFVWRHIMFCWLTHLLWWKPHSHIYGWNPGVCFSEICKAYFIAGSDIFRIFISQNIPWADYCKTRKFCGYYIWRFFK